MGVVNVRVGVVDREMGVVIWCINYDFTEVTSIIIIIWWVWLM